MMQVVKQRKQTLKSQKQLFCTLLSRHLNEDFEKLSRTFWYDLYFFRDTYYVIKLPGGSQAWKDL